VSSIQPFDSPLLLGFEHTRALIERAARTTAETFPPYNVEALGEGGARIVLAVAGFGAARLEVTIEANQLTVTGRREAEEERDFLHRGIAARGFVRVFILADGMEVGRAWLDHGLLHIEATRPKASKGVRHIAIESIPQPVSPGSR
jgi:HSP20 family molecular chaperone IbpA